MKYWRSCTPPISSDGSGAMRRRVARTSERSRGTSNGDERRFLERQGAQ